MMLVKANAQIWMEESWLTTGKEICSVLVCVHSSPSAIWTLES